VENQVTIVKAGVCFKLKTSNRVRDEHIDLQFCHKDHNGTFQNGITSEGMIQALLSRHEYLVAKDSSTENVRVLLFLRQAYDALKERKNNKRLSKNDNKTDSISVSP
jgi:hypothetical protein